MANTVLAGDYSGLISFKGDKKGLLITENKFFGAKKTFINKTTVDHYELVMQEGNSSMGGPRRCWRSTLWRNWRHRWS